MPMDQKKMIGNVNIYMCLAAASLFTAINVGTAVPAAGAESLSASMVSQTDRLVVSGKVLDAQGQPVPGASVIETGTTNGVNTDADGKFSMEVRRGAKLEVSCIGYTTVTVVANSEMSITIHEDKEFLDEVVVVGYGTQKKANLTGAVSTVDVSKTLENRPVADVGKALQGAVPGLTVLNSSGAVNSSPKITIRGLGTLSNKATSNPLIVVDGVVMDDISYLNPNDIDNISVLKDAASTSIYGTRAAFGVILITTKSASTAEKVSVTYSNNFAWQKPTVLPSYSDVPSQIVAFQDVNNRIKATPELFGMVFNDEFLQNAQKWQESHGGRRSGWREVVLGDDFEVRAADGKGNYYADWDVAGIMFKNWTPHQSHNFAVQGTSGRTSYYMSVGYNKEEGTVRFNPDKMNRWNVSSNVTTSPTTWLQLGVRFNFDRKNYTTSYGMGQGTYQYIWRWGSMFGPYGTYNGQDFRTISYRKQAGSDEYVYDYTRVGGFAKIKIIDGLTVNADYTYNIYDLDENWNQNPIYGYNSWGAIAEPEYISTATTKGEYSSRNLAYAFNAYVDYTKTFARKHNLHVMVGINAEEGSFRDFSGTRKTLLDNTLPEFSLATGDMTVSGSHSHWGTAGYFGRINYDYDGIWLLELNGRYDGSSRFPQHSHWAFFPSASAGYRISQEKWFEPIRPIVSDAKIRASFGEIGNEAIGSNMFVSSISKKGDSYVYWTGDGTQKVSMYNMPSLVDADLSWERIQTLDVGADLGFMNNDLKVTFDWYQRTTLDMLAPAASLPGVLGATAPYTNNGTLRTRGWELAIDWHHVFGDLVVYANASVGDFKSKVTKWSNDTKSLNSTYQGMTYGDIWGFETDRLFTPEDFTGFDADGNPTGYAPGVPTQVGIQTGSFVYGPGDTKYKDLNGDGKIDGGEGTADNHGDLKVIGNTQPRYQYSFRLGGSWKGFDLDIFFQGIGKRDVWSQSAFVIPYYRGADAIYSNQMDYWKGTFSGGKWTVTNADAEYPRLYAGNNGTGKVPGIDRGDKNFYPQSKWLSHMAYLRLKNLTFGYTLPQHLTRKIYLEKVRVYFSGENLFELINNTNGAFDPEINTGDGSMSNGVFGRTDPMYRTISFGIQLTL